MWVRVLLLNTPRCPARAAAPAGAPFSLCHVVIESRVEAARSICTSCGPNHHHRALSSALAHGVMAGWVRGWTASISLFAARSVPAWENMLRQSLALLYSASAWREMDRGARTAELRE